MSNQESAVGPPPVSSAWLVLCRHGNTFEAGAPTYMVGVKEDLPLTSKGEEQASNIGDALVMLGWHEYAIFAAPLKRTRRCAELVHERISTGLPSCHASLSFDTRLTELDYGAWSGLSHEQIRARFGEQELRAWDEEGQHPESAAFQPNPPTVDTEIQSLLSECTSRPCSVLVTSQGRLKAFARLLGVSAPRKVRTGSICLARYAEERWRVEEWDVLPERLGALSARPSKLTS